jgi:hypothetical protein
MNENPSDQQQPELKPSEQSTGSMSGSDKSQKSPPLVISTEEKTRNSTESMRMTLHKYPVGPRITFKPLKQQ